MFGKTKIKKSSLFVGGLKIKNVKLYVGSGNAAYITIVVMVAKRIHLFPYRTQKLSSLTPKVLVGTLTGRIGNRHFSTKNLYLFRCKFFFIVDR